MVAICYQRQYNTDVMNQDVQHISLQEEVRHIGGIFWFEDLVWYAKRYINQSPVPHTEFIGGITYMIIPNKLKLL